MENLIKVKDENAKVECFINGIGETDWNDPYLKRLIGTSSAGPQQYIQPEELEGQELNTIILESYSGRLVPMALVRWCDFEPYVPMKVATRSSITIYCPHCNDQESWDNLQWVDKGNTVKCGACHKVYKININED